MMFAQYWPFEPRSLLLERLPRRDPHPSRVARPWIPGRGYCIAALRAFENPRSGCQHQTWGDQRSRLLANHSVALLWKFWRL